METVLHEIFVYYGLDWMSMIFGLWGSYLVTQRRAVGFAMVCTASFTALAVAFLSGQYGFIVYNTISMGIALKGYWGWTKAPVPVRS